MVGYWIGDAYAGGFDAGLDRMLKRGWLDCCKFDANDGLTITVLQMAGEIDIEAC